MSRTSLLLLVALVFLSFGYTVDRRGSDAPSKIYLFNSTLIRTTPGQDIRLYDIGNPASPRSISTIAIDGNSDVAVMDHFMYADRNTDLVVFDIADPSHPRGVDTIRRVFDQPYYYYGVVDDMPEDQVVGGTSGCNGCTEDTPVDYAPRAASTDASQSGQGGSLARFVIVGDYLYCIDMSTLTVFDVSDPGRPRYKNKVSVGWSIETIFPSGSYLFIGGSQGMYVYDATDGENPTYVSEFTHANSCDPVVVEGNRAYVTLRGGSRCGGFSNQLDIIDISDIRNPRLIRTVPLNGPYGLAVRDGVVLVCDGESGVKLVDTNGDAAPRVVLNDITSYDLILRDNLLVVTAESGYYLYDASDLAHPARFSMLP
jgi:hypothetical protein